MKRFRTLLSGLFLTAVVLMRIGSGVFHTHEGGLHHHTDVPGQVTLEESEEVCSGCALLAGYEVSNATYSVIAEYGQAVLNTDVVRHSPQAPAGADRGRSPPKC